MDIGHIDVQGVPVPELGLGTWQLRGEACRHAVHEALELGYRHIDTAQAYGNEEDVGAAVAESGLDRGELFITTKIKDQSLAPDRVAPSVDASLRRLRVDALDLLLIHWPVDDFDVIERALVAMTRLRDEGKTRLIGVSNFDPSQLERSLDVAPVAADQVQFHPFLHQDELVELAERHGLTTTAYSPLGRGEVMRDPTIKEIAERHGATPAQVALRWLLDHPRASVIPKASSREHLADNLGALRLHLTDEDRAAIDELDRARSVL